MGIIGYKCLVNLDSAEYQATRGGGGWIPGVVSSQSLL